MDRRTGLVVWAIASSFVCLSCGDQAPNLRPTAQITSPGRDTAVAVNAPVSFQGSANNEVMVQRTLGEFKDLYAALLTYFRREIQARKIMPLTQFMFTRFVTKLISFRRRIGTLVGYTGGESIEQIVLDPVIAALPVRYLPAFRSEQQEHLGIG